jgi:hypothetical protein
MRRALPLFALLLLARCTSVSDYSPDSGSTAPANSSLQGSESGAGVQAPFWSNDPSKKTISNQTIGQ